MRCRCETRTDSAARGAKGPSARALSEFIHDTSDEFLCPLVFDLGSHEYGVPEGASCSTWSLAAYNAVRFARGITLPFFGLGLTDTLPREEAERLLAESALRTVEVALELFPRFLPGTFVGDMAIATDTSAPDEERGTAVAQLLERNGLGDPGSAMFALEKAARDFALDEAAAGFQTPLRAEFKRAELGPGWSRRAKGYEVSLDVDPRGDDPRLDGGLEDKALEHLGADSAERFLERIRQIATTAQWRAVESLARGEVLSSANRNALYHLRRKLSSAGIRAS